MREYEEMEPIAGRSSRAVGYVLASGLRSWDVEVRRMRAMAGRWGWSLVRTWEEEPRYGLLEAEERPAFAAMLAELGALEVGVVMVPDAGSLSPDPMVRTFMIRRVVDLGAQVSELPRGRRGRLRRSGGAG